MANIGYYVSVQTWTEYRKCRTAVTLFVDKNFVAAIGDDWPVLEKVVKQGPKVDSKYANILILDEE